MKNGKKRAKKLNIFILTFESSDFYTTFNFKFQINGDIVIKFRLMLIIIWPYFKLSMLKLFKSKFKVSKTHLIGNILLGQYTNNKYVICLVFSFKRLNRKFPDLLVYFWKDIIYFSPCKVYLQLFIHTENFRESSVEVTPATMVISVSCIITKKGAWSKHNNGRLKDLGFEVGLFFVTSFLSSYCDDVVF